MVDIRRTTVEDADALRDIRLAALRSDPAAFGSTSAREAEFEPRVWRERAAGSADSATFVAVVDGTFVGLVTAAVTAEVPDRVELTSMWTAPAVRGRGIGSRLVDAVLGWADARHTSRVSLWVMRGNSAAYELYERCGFEETDEDETSEADPCRNEVRMRRRSLPSV